MKQKTRLAYLAASAVSVFLLSTCESQLLDTIAEDAKPLVAVIELEAEGVSVGDGATVHWPDTYESDQSDVNVTVRNSGTGELRLTGEPRVVVDPAVGFEVQAQPDSPIPPSGAEIVTIRFTPEAVGVFEAECSIEVDGGEGSRIIHVTLSARAVPDPQTPAPNGVTATFGASVDEVTVGWNPVTGATYYQIYRYPAGATPNESDSPAGTVLGGSSTSWSDDTATCVPGTLYDYYVRANGSEYGLSGMSSKATGYRLLSAVTGVAASWATDTSSVSLNWTSLDGAQVYDVYRSTSTSRPSSPTFEGVARPYADTAANAGVRYYYWVRGRGDTGTDPGPVSASSGEGCLELMAPDDLTGYVPTSYHLQISWDAVPGASGYYVEKALVADGVFYDWLLNDPPVLVEDTMIDDSMGYPSNYPEPEWDMAFNDHYYRVRTYNSELDIYSDWYTDDEAFSTYGGG